MAKSIIYKDGKPVGEVDTESEEYLKGLGDLIHKFALPIANAIDSIAGTDLKNCGGCQDRQEKLNQAVPFKR